MTGRYLTSSQLAARYDRTLRTIHRWIKNPPEGFPQPIMIAGRHHWSEQEIADFERLCAAKAAKAA